jgi:holo-[acyl-carrier protein] synthase
MGLSAKECKANEDARNNNNRIQKKYLILRYKMIKGIGTDIIEVERVTTKNSKKKNGFREFVFSTEEIKYCENKTNTYEHYAARFAAKEALGKALGLGWVEGITIKLKSKFQQHRWKAIHQFYWGNSQTNCSH